MAASHLIVSVEDEHGRGELGVALRDGVDLDAVVYAGVAALLDAAEL